MVRKVTTVLRGGLGNQLFQFAAGWLAATTQGTRLVIDHSLVSLRGTDDRPQALTSFLLPTTNGAPVTFNCSSFRATRTAGVLRRARRRLSNEIRLPMVLTDRDAPRYCAQVREEGQSRAVSLVDGYFGSEELIALCEARGFPPRMRLANPTNVYRELRTEIQRARTIHVHIRLGDFVDLGLAQSPDWYARAILDSSAGSYQPDIRVFTDAPVVPETYLEAIRDVCRPGQIWTLDRTKCPDGPTALDLLSRSSTVVFDPSSTFGWWAHRWSRSTSGLTDDDGI